jgi:uncharacterized protein involved in type VI secretion and phage assembly
MPIELEHIIANLVRKVEHRFYGKYRGIVNSNQDPENLGRLKVVIPSVLGDEAVVWASPCVPFGGDANQGFYFIPEDGSGVWIEFEEGDPEFPIWVGTFWSKPDDEAEAPKPNAADGSEESVPVNSPSRKIIKTMRGHTIQFEDADGDEMITIVEAAHSHVITMNGEGIAIADGANGNTVKMESGGIKIEDQNGNAVTMDSGGVHIGGEKKVCLEGLLDWLMSHTHVGNLGGPTPLNPADMSKLAPLKAAPDGSILSMKTFMG